MQAARLTADSWFAVLREAFLIERLRQAPLTPRSPSNGVDQLASETDTYGRDGGDCPMRQQEWCHSSCCRGPRVSS